MTDNDKEIIIRCDLDEYIEDIISGLSDEEYQEIIDSTSNGYLTGIITPEHIKKHLRNSLLEVMLKNLKP